MCTSLVWCTVKFFLQICFYCGLPPGVIVVKLFFFSLCFCWQGSLGNTFFMLLSFLLSNSFSSFSYIDSTVFCYLCLWESRLLMQIHLRVCAAFRWPMISQNDGVRSLQHSPVSWCSSFVSVSLSHSLSLSLSLSPHTGYATAHCGREGTRFYSGSDDCCWCWCACNGCMLCLGLWASFSDVSAALVALTSAHRIMGYVIFHF